MLKHRVFKLAIFASVLGSYSALAQDVPSLGLYQIVSGTYSECCGISGMPTLTLLPNSEQAFVSLSLDSTSGSVRMTFLGQDRATPFSRVPCSQYGPIQFSLPFGFASADAISFHVDPGPPPYQSYWTYTASNSAYTLRVDGAMGIAPAGCSDTPTQFGHSKLLATLISPPMLTFRGFSTNQAIMLLIQGHPGHTNITEASGDLKNWVPVSTNVMDYSLCPICPYAIVEDLDSTNRMRRFYRVGEF